MHDAAAVPVTQSLTVVGSKVVPTPTVSLPSGEMVCRARNAPFETSAEAEEGPTTVGVYVEVTARPAESDTW